MIRPDKRNTPYHSICHTTESHKPDKPTADQTFSVCHDAVNQFLDGRNVMDQAHYHTTTPGARIHVAIDHNFWINARDFAGGASTPFA
jgi:hypothetical protein